MDNIRAVYRIAFACLVATLGVACSSGGSVGIGGGQAADPGTVDFPIAYVKRTIPEDGDDLREQRDTMPDADLFFRTRASPSATEVNITARRRTAATDRYDIRDVDVSPDGRRIVFAMRGPLEEDPDEIEDPFWEIWEYTITTDVLHRVITSDIIAGAGNDVAPQYLPDGRIIFSSTRQSGSKAMLLDEGKPGFEAQTDTRNESAFLLHVMDGDGTNIHQITYNQSHDMWPSVLADGRIAYMRWDGATGRGMHLYTANPDGTNVQLLYGARSHMTGTPDDTGAASRIEFTRPREMQDGRILVLARPFGDTDFGGDLVLVNACTNVEINQTLLNSSCSAAGPAQGRATPNEVSTVEGPSPGGRFRSAYPLWDGSNRLLVSWSLCRLIDNGVTPAATVPCTNDRLTAVDFATRYETAPPLYSAFIFNPADNTFKPLFTPVEGVMVTDLVAAQPRTPPVTRLDHAITAETDALDGANLGFNTELVGAGLGVLEIRSVYDFDGTLRNAGTGTTDIATLANPALRTAAQRPARFLRIEKPVSIGDNDVNADFPDLDNDAFGASNFMREILGYVPIEPDGSVSVRLPANTAFVVSIVDTNGRRVAGFPQHRAWMQLRPGEIRRCGGCHQAGAAAATDRSHGREGTMPVLPWTGAAASGTPFPNTLAAAAANAMPGDTMARARARTTCVAGTLCSQIPSVNLIYDDVWTDPVVRPADASLAVTYGGATGLTTPAPTRASCATAWNSTCRIRINYVEHIHPLWSVDRGAGTCTNCHSDRDANNAVQVPAGVNQLDLQDGDSQQVPAHKNAYRELLFAGTLQQIVGGVLTDVIVQVPTGEVDPVTGLPITEPQTVPSARSLTPGNANGSTRFFARFADNSGTVNHTGFLTTGELRLISEWVDIGAQYFNDPFADGVPVN